MKGLSLSSINSKRLKATFKIGVILLYFFVTTLACQQFFHISSGATCMLSQGACYVHVHYVHYVHVAATPQAPPVGSSLSPTK